MTSALQSGKINLSRVHGRIVQVVPSAKSPTTAKATYDLAYSSRREGLHPAEADPVLRHGCRRRHERAREEVRPEVDRRPEEGGRIRSAFLECKTRNTCLVGYKKQHGLTSVSFVPLSGISVRALDADTIQAVTGSRSAAVRPHTALADPKHVTGFQNVALIVKSSVMTASARRSRIP
jgi:hypothetical protein